MCTCVSKIIVILNQMIRIYQIIIVQMLMYQIIVVQINIAAWIAPWVERLLVGWEIQVQGRVESD